MKIRKRLKDKGNKSRIARVENIKRLEELGGHLFQTIFVHPKMIKELKKLPPP